MEAAVVSASHGAMASLLGKLAELLSDKYKLLKEARGQIMFLQAELESMHAFLKKISDTEEPGEQDKCWAKEVRELSYDIEDSVTEFMLRVERKSRSKPHGFKGFIDKSKKLLTTMNARHEIAKEFEALKVRVVEVSNRRMRYQQIDKVANSPNMIRCQQFDDVASRPPNITTIDGYLLAIYAETSGLVAIEGPRDELIQLMDGEPAAHQLKVLSIVGFGGLGKTTLANAIYHKLEGKFQCRAFVSVSQKPNVRKILKTILSQVGFVASKDTNMEIWEEPELISTLRKFLLEQRYFIVIDDIWDASAWRIIRCALPEHMNGSRVMTTTRIETVARSCCINHLEYVYKMKPLSEQDSKRLFFKRLFGSEEACPPYLQQVSAEILKKCGGLPLAIITISSLLASQPNKLKEHWVYVRNSLGSNFEVSPSLEGMRQILNLSYINLPHCLKTCMLYLGIYPEDRTIYMFDLTRQWVAEGFISNSHGTNPEDVAKSYFNELVNRSIIQPTHTTYNGEVMSCRVHDMMLDLILHKSKEENFITVLDGRQDITRHDKIRRLTLHMVGAMDDAVLGSIHLSHIRTLAIFATTSHDLGLPMSYGYEIQKGSRSSYLSTFGPLRHLRILSIEVSRVPSSPVLLDFTAIRELFQLRHLNIVALDDPVVLPNKIGDLHLLETFQLKTPVLSCEGQSFDKLPSDIVHMDRLLHLIVPLWRRLPDGIGNMKSLRTLHGFNLVTSSPDNIKDLRELTNLTDLVIGCRTENLFDTTTNKELEERGREVLRACLEKLCNLKHLQIDTSHYHACLDVLSPVPAAFCHLQRFHALNHFCMFSRVPGWIHGLHNLYDLKLMVDGVLEEDIGILAQLSSLIHLHLHIQGVPKEKIIIPASGFPVLKHLKVGCCRISYLMFEAGAMPRLEKLRIWFNAQGWDRYGAAPVGIEHLSALKEIYVDIGGDDAREANRRAAESAMREAADMHPSCLVANIKVNSGRYIFDGMYSEPRKEDGDDGGSSSTT